MHLYMSNMITNETNPNSLIVEPPVFKPPVAEFLLCKNSVPLLDEPDEKSEEVREDIREKKIREDIREKSSINMDELMNKLEREGMEKVQKVWATPLTSPITSNVFQQIMEKGANEFKEKTGRNMTYSELRSLYG